MLNFMQGGIVAVLFLACGQDDVDRGELFATDLMPLWNFFLRFAGDTGKFCED